MRSPAFAEVPAGAGRLIQDNGPHESCRSSRRAGPRRSTWPGCGPRRAPPARCGPTCGWSPRPARPTRTCWTLGAGGAPEGLVIAAESQTAGRGRQGRSWQSRPAAALTFSVLLRPRSVPPAAGAGCRCWPESPLPRRCGTVDRRRCPAEVAQRRRCVGGGKLAGILAEQSGDAIVVGIGINVLGRDARPAHGHGDVAGARRSWPDATGPSCSRRSCGELERWYLRWRETGSGDAAASGLRPEYLSLCATLGRLVRVQLPGDRIADRHGGGRGQRRPAAGQAATAATRRGQRRRRRSRSLTGSQSAPYGATFSC